MLHFCFGKKRRWIIVGIMSLGVSRQHKRAELAYWVGRPYWGQGFVTEAAKRIVQFGFEDLELNRIFAAAMTNNPGSYKVMEEIGDIQTAVLKWGVFEDLIFYGITKPNYDAWFKKERHD